MLRISTAVSAEARKKFWLDRSRTATIARHTNAFKINEDVVIPFNRLGEYTDHIERINIELSIRNKLQLLDELEAYLKGPLPLDKPGDAEDADAIRIEVLAERTRQAQALTADTRQRWRWILENLDSPLMQTLPHLPHLGLSSLQAALTERVAQQPLTCLFDVVQARSGLRVSWKTEVWTTARRRMPHGSRLAVWG